MKTPRFVFRNAVLALVLSSHLANGGGIPSVQAETTGRPPQFVLLAFDGSLNNGFWTESLAFAKATSIKYTYFISGVYFLLEKNKNLYREPVMGVGKSAIGWGGKTPDRLSLRIEHLNEAFAEGNELGSHANGHFDGTRYTYAQWKDELSQFWGLIFDVFKNNPETHKIRDLIFSRKNITGFRAPQLGRSAETDRALVEEGYLYDTSRTATLNYWPRKTAGLWNFPLARVTIAGSAKQTLSMDYNFYVSQSGAKDDLPNADRFEREMLQTYQNYFLNNYNGNRAPVHIGHHFAKWNGGAYWKAMKRFSQAVCDLPEVRCVTYTELQEFMDQRSESEINAYQAGNFPRSAPIALPEVLRGAKPIQLAATLEDAGQGSFSAVLTGRDLHRVARKNSALVWSVDGKTVSVTPVQSVSIQAIHVRLGQSLKIAVVRNGREILSVTKAALEVAGPYRIKQSETAVALPKESFEDRAVQGDLPEAHFHPSVMDAPLPQGRIQRAHQGEV